MTTAAMTFYSTSIGKKVVMAVSGFIFFGFVVVHMLGNLQIYISPQKINDYAAFLHDLGWLLWAFRAVIAAAAVLHIVSATQVTLQSWAARPRSYRLHRMQETTYAARTMRWGGVIIAAFVLYHVLHLTTGTVHPDGGEFVRADVYNNVIAGLSVPWVSAVYIVANFLVALHLYHGAWSMFQTVGASHEKWNPLRRVFAVFFAAAVGVGNISIPVSVLAGWLQPV